MPVEEPIVATAGVLLVHTPPGVASVSVVVEATHNPETPAIGDAAFTVMVRRATQLPIE